MIPSPPQVAQQTPADVAELMAKWNDALTTTLRAQPSMARCANQMVSDALAKLFEKNPTEHIYLKNPDDSLTDPPTAQDSTLKTLALEAIQQCRIPSYYNQRSDFYLYKSGSFHRLNDPSQIAIRTLMNNLLGVDYYLTSLNQYWNANHSVIPQPRRTYIAQVLALLIQCEASLRFETASLEPASVALLRQLTTTALPDTLNIFNLSVQDTAHTLEMVLVSAFALCTWPLNEQRTANPTVLYLPGQGLAEFTSPTALKAHLTRLLKTVSGRQTLRVGIAHRHYTPLENLAPRAREDARVNLTPIAAVEYFFNDQADLLISKQQQDIQYHWAANRDDPEGVMKKIDQAANLAPLLDFSTAIKRHVRPLLIANIQRREAALTAQQRLIQLQAERLIDFTGLITQLSGIQHRSAQQPLTDQFFTPHPQSPLFKACARAVEVLKKLKDDTDFADWMSKRSSPTEINWSPLVVVEKLLNNQPALTDSPLTRFTVQDVLLPLSKVPTYWRNDVNVLIAARHDIGDGIREDGTVRLDLALKFYGFNIATHSQLQRLIERLQDHVATLSLGMDESQLPFDEIIDEQDDANLQRQLEQRQRAGNTSILEQMTTHFLTPHRETQIFKTPTAVLEDWFKTRQCFEFGSQLAKALNWYTADGETPPATVLRNLVWRTLWLYYEGPKNNARVTVVGEEIAQPRHWGQSYSYIRRQIEQSLAHNSQLTPGGVKLALRLLQHASASEFWVKDIPDDLHYASSITWVNFKTGVALAQAISPGAAQHMTFQQLLDFPAKASQDATPEKQMVLALARMGPTLEWARANGVLPAGKTEFSVEQAQLALETLEQHEDEIIQATTTIAQAPPGRWRFTSDEEFDQGFNHYLRGVKSAYQTLIRALLPNLLPYEREEIEHGRLTLYALRQEQRHITLERETAQLIGADRGRHGFIIQAQVKHRTTYYEVFPKAAVIRARPDIQTLTINGKVVVESTGGSSRSGKASFRRATPMPFDWAAYREGGRPKDGVSSLLIAEQIGEVLPATEPTPSEHSWTAQSFSSARSRQLTAIVANEHFHTQESELRLAALRNTTVFDSANEALDETLDYLKMVVPFWGAVEDLLSGDPQRVERGGLALYTDLVSFALPVGKFLGGSARLIVQAGKIGFRAALPRFATLTKGFLLNTLRELNPLEAIPPLLKFAGLSALRLSTAAIRQIDAGLELLRKTLRTPPIPHTGRALQPVDPRAWKPLEPQDSLYTVAGIDHVPMRRVGTELLPEYRLIDALTNKVFGPRYIPMGEDGLQRIPDLDDYIVPVPYEQTVTFSRRANGVYDGKNQQSYVRARGQWYAVETRYSLTGDTEFYIVHPHNKTRPAHRIVNNEGVWTPVGESGQAGGKRGRAGGKRMAKIREATAERNANFQHARDRMDIATTLMDQAAQSLSFKNRSALYDKSRLHREAAQELGLVHKKNNELPVFRRQDFITRPDEGKSQLINSIEVANRLSPRYTAVIDDLEGYLAVQQKHLEPMKELVEAEGELKTLVTAKQIAVNTLIEQAKEFKSLLDEDLEQMLATLETYPANQAGPSHAPTINPLPPAPPNIAPQNRARILVADVQHRTTREIPATPRAANSDIVDILDNNNQRIATYINSGEDRLWVISPIEIKEPSVLAGYSQTQIIQELNTAIRELKDTIEEHDELIRFYRRKTSSDPAGAEARLKSGANRLHQGADDLEAACTAVTDDVTRQGLMAQANHFKQEANRFDTMANLVRRNLIISQAPDAKGLAFLHSQPNVLSIRKTLDRIAITQHRPIPGSKDWIRVPDFLDEFRIYAYDKLWGYAHVHFEQASHSVPVRSHLTTPDKGGMGLTAKPDVVREGRRADIYRAELDWPLARQIFYSTAPS